MRRLSQKFEGFQSGELNSDKIDEIGIVLIRSFASLEIAAQTLGYSVSYLKFLIHEEFELQEYFRIAQEGVKGLVDKNIIEGLKDGNPDVVKLVFGKMYAGRNKGGFNPSEIGTAGYNDKVGRKLAAETAQDRAKGQVQVNFNFIKKEIRTDFEQIGYENSEYVDGEEVPPDE